MSSPRREWEDARRLVVKIGSALLVDRDTGVLKRDWLTSLVDDLAALAGNKRQIVLVSSGAIALGRRAVALPAGPLKLEENQAAAAVGQIALGRAYQELFAARDLNVGQILLTLGDTEERRRYLNARNTIETLLKLGVIPVVNENDTVATSEIRYGDNDRLAARVASMVSADVLVLLSDVDGFYTAPPGSTADAHRLDEVREITPEIEAMAGDVGSELSRGGMVTKVAAAKIAASAGTHMVITSGKVNNPLAVMAAGGPATWFVAPQDPQAARKRWISGSLEPRGRVVIDDGALKALRSGKSLLPAGVTGVTGAFDRGDAVVVVDARGQEVARGIVAFAHADAQKILGLSSARIAEILGYVGRTEMIHRDDLAMVATGR